MRRLARMRMQTLPLAAIGAAAAAISGADRDAVREGKGRGVPVVASTGALAAGGGCWIAADAIVARPGTIARSIGVLAGKFQAAWLWERLRGASGRLPPRAKLRPSASIAPSPQPSEASPTPW